MSNDERESNNMEPLVPGGDATIIGVVATAVGAFLATVIKVLSGRQKTNADATVTVLGTWQSIVNELRRDIEALRIEVREARQELTDERVGRLKCEEISARQDIEIERLGSQLNTLLVRGVAVPERSDIARRAAKKTAAQRRRT